MLESDLQKLIVEGMITLYELDATKFGAGIFRWHGHATYEDWKAIEAWAGSTDTWAGSTEVRAGSEVLKDQYQVHSDIIWQGQAYSAVPIQTTGLDMRGDGKASTPTLSISSDINGVRGMLRILCLQYEDFAGAKLTVTHTLAKYLDAENFIEGNPQAANEYRSQLWYVEQKTSENASAVTFELSNPVDFEGARIPSREITSFCHWAVHGRYRGVECKYMGTARFTEDGKPTDNPELDKCGARLSDCRLRNNSERFGGYPSSSLKNS